MLVDLRNEYPPLRRIINLFEPDGPDRATDIEDGGNADFPREFSILDYRCHAEIMGELPGGCKVDNLTYVLPSLGHHHFLWWVDCLCFSCPEGQKPDFRHSFTHDDVERTRAFLNYCPQEEHAALGDLVDNRKKLVDNRKKIDLK